MRDQRSMTGSRHLSTVAEVETKWSQWGARRPAGWEGRVTPVTDPRTVHAYVSAARWVADCPACNGGIACWSENPRGACLSCGHIYTVTFPPEAERIEAILEERPPRNRHWALHESVDQLEAENTVLLPQERG